MVNFVCSFTFCLSLMFAVGFTAEAATLAPEIILTFLKELRPTQPTVRIRFLSAAICIKVASGTCLIFNVLELFCYVIIFFEMYKHHKRHVRLCLSNKPKIANLQRRQNTITAVGHFASWVVEFLILGMFQNFLSANHGSVPFFCWIFLRFFMPSINYLVFPTVQSIASKDLRAHVFNLECCSSEGCFCVNCIAMYGEQNVPAAAQENIQLHALQNGHAQHL